jgi:hypothetical protein
MFFRTKVVEVNPLWVLVNQTAARLRRGSSAIIPPAVPFYMENPYGLSIFK